MAAAMVFVVVAFAGFFYVSRSYSSEVTKPAGSLGDISQESHKVQSSISDFFADDCFTFHHQGSSNYFSLSPQNIPFQCSLDDVEVLANTIVQCQLERDIMKQSLSANKILKELTKTHLFKFCKRYDGTLVEKLREMENAIHQIDTLLDSRNPSTELEDKLDKVTYAVQLLLQEQEHQLKKSQAKNSDFRDDIISSSDDIACATINYIERVEDRIASFGAIYADAIERKQNMYEDFLAINHFYDKGTLFADAIFYIFVGVFVFFQLIHA